LPEAPSLGLNVDAPDLVEWSRGVVAWIVGGTTLYLMVGSAGFILALTVPIRGQREIREKLAAQGYSCP